METEAITISAPPAIHVGPIVNPVSNETISIVIPLSAQLATVARATIQPRQDCNDTKSEISSNTEIQTHSQLINSQTTSIQIQKSTLTSILQKADKTKGCPFPTCSRYGRAFSRAHDLKRHIARHEMRKERLCDPPTSDIRTCGQCGENFLNDAVLERHMNIHAIPSTNNDATNTNGNNTYPCHLCKKKYNQLSKLKSHMATHNKNSVSNICTLCGNQYENAEKLDDHMKTHTTHSILDGQNALEISTSPKQINVEDDNDDFMLEEMLLLNKNPRFSTAGKSSDITSTSSNGKIRCDYCSKTFKTKWTLSSHVAAHEGRYQFGCSRCGKKFVRKSHYDGHVRSHEAARPYICDQCGKTFKELKHRREHTKRKHPSNQNAIQNLLDSISACVAEESSIEQTKFTLLMPMNFTA